MNNQSEKMFTNVIREKQKQYEVALSGLLRKLSNNQQSKKLEANKHLLKVAQELSSALAEGDRPWWLNETIEATDEYARKNKNPQSIVSGSSWTLLQRLIEVHKHAMGYKWKFDETEELVAYDFDAIFEKSRQSSNVAELFDSMIGALEKMLETEEIDSIKANQALRKLMSTLAQNKTGSYFSTVVTWQFVRSFTKNYMWESLGSIPGVQPIKSAFEKILEETDIEMDQLHEEMSSELRERFDIAPTDALASSKQNPLWLDNDSRDTECQ